MFSSSCIPSRYAKGTVAMNTKLPNHYKKEHDIFVCSSCHQVTTKLCHTFVFPSLSHLLFAFGENVLENACQKAFSQTLISSECDGTMGVKLSEVSLRVKGSLKKKFDCLLTIIGKLLTF